MSVQSDLAIVSVEQMRALEQRAFEAGLSETTLQHNAAAAVALTAERADPARGTAVVLIGPGNNGRDAFLAGRLLAAAGREVVYVLGPRHAVAEVELGGLDPVRECAFQVSNADEVWRLRQELARASLVLDGLLGIGVRGPLRAPLDGLAVALNEARATGAPRVVSVDVPSGIDADTGGVPGAAVRADLTVALGAVKQGCIRFPALELVGELVPSRIGLPAGADVDCPLRLLSSESVSGLIPGRPLASHKGSLGWVLVVGGSREYLGAPILSASAAARSGCGLVALGVPPRVQLAAAASLPEATYLLLEDDSPPADQAAAVLHRLGSFQALLVGPGLGRDERAHELVKRVLSGLAERHAPGPIPTVIDADALYVLAGWDSWWSQIPPGCVLTPHYGEMARLSGRSAAEVSERNWEIALERAAAWQQIVVLKGPQTVVATPDGRAWVHSYANPGLATAGSGDVLAGLIVGLAAQGLAAADAARLAVAVHGRAGAEVLASNRWQSLIASDLVGALPRVLNDLSRSVRDAPTGP